MFKKVNVYPDMPIYALQMPITNVAMGIKLSVGDIANCLYKKAKIEEVLEDGTLVQLDLSNYDKDNSKFMKKKPEIKVEQPKKEIPKIDSTFIDKKEDVIHTQEQEQRAKQNNYKNNKNNNKK